MRRVVEAIRLCSNARRSGKRTNRAHQATAIDTVIDIAASHGNTCISQHVSRFTTTIDALVNSNLLSALGYSDIGVRISTDIHEGIASYVSLSTTAKHVACDMGTERYHIIVFDRCCDILTVFNI